MKHKTMALALGALCAALLALPAMASAAEWSIDPESGKFPLKFTAAGLEAKLTSSAGTVTCTKNAGTGQYNTATTGTIELTFEGCLGPFGSSDKCTTTGSPEKTITTTTLEFHNIMIDPTAAGGGGGTPGVLITPNAGHFATFICAIAGEFKVTGNGIIGDVSNPTCATNAFQNTATLNFESSSTGVQKYMQVETTGTKFDLETDTAIGKVTSSEDAEGTVTFAEKAKMTCP